MSRRIATTVAVLVLAVTAACGTSEKKPEAEVPAPSVSAPAEGHAGHDTPAAAPRSKSLRAGERRVQIRMPKAYTPSAPTGVGTDDYRCFLLDPKVVKDSFVTGFNVLPGNPDVVHHVILFRVPPGRVTEAEEKDAETPGEGWTCFGTSGLGNDATIDDAPWLGAWAPGGSEQLYGKGLGEEFDAGSRIVMQVHYNLVEGTEPDTSAAQLRLTEDPATTPLLTQLLPVQVELPCRPGHTGNKLCDRAEAMKDVQARFGPVAKIADYLHLLCGSDAAGPVQSCTRKVQVDQTIRGVAGHMHLLGRSIKIETNPGTSRARTVLDIPVWNFDDQGSTPTPAIKLAKGDTIKVTCRHTQALRDQLPAFKGHPDRYVVWGEGTTDEMCLGILLVTRP